MRRPFTAPALLAGLSIAGCASAAPPPVTPPVPPAKLAVLSPQPVKPVQVVEVPKPLPTPGQLKSISTSKASKHKAANTRGRITDANRAARMEPQTPDYINAIQVYPFSDGALYEVYAAPGEVTDLALEAGEQLVGSGPVAAGDTVRWIIGDTESGTGPTKRNHILIKPTRAELSTNLVINTDRRTYHLELRSLETAYMASVSWAYPTDQLIALHRQAAAEEAPAPIAKGIDLEALNFRYDIQGDHPAWRPVRAFDDGHQVIIEFPEGIAQGEMPPLWIIGAAGDAELVNYRVNGRHIIVDRLFAAAELRLGAKRQDKVRIVRTDGTPRS